MKIKIIIIGILILIIGTFIGIKINLDYRSKNLIGLPKGELKYSKLSPDKRNKLNYYFINGGSISADAMRIEIETNKEKYNLYYCYSECDFESIVEWKDNQNIMIGNRIINIKGEKIKE